jgi:hypothetical protein
MNRVYLSKKLLEIAWVEGRVAKLDMGDAKERLKTRTGKFRRCGLHVYGRVLDVGMGSGVDLLAMFSLNLKIEAVGVDFCRGALKFAKAILPKEATNLVSRWLVPTRLEQLPEMLRLDKKGELKPFIYGILHDLNLISPTIFIADENFENQQILLCKIPQDINERIKCAQSFLSALKKESEEVNEKSKQKTLKKCAQIFEKLIFGQEWIRENCQRICIGKVNCPLLASGKVYEVIKRLL